jgi:hypothetical protein
MTDQHDKHNVTKEGDQYKLTITCYFDSMDEANTYAENLPNKQSPSNLQEVQSSAIENTLSRNEQNQNEQETTSNTNNDSVDSESSTTSRPDEETDVNSKNSNTDEGDSSSKDKKRGS